MQSATPRPTIWTRDFIALFLANFLLFVGFQMQIPTMPVYVQSRGGDQLMVGMVITVFTITAVISRPFSGWALDVLARRFVVQAGMVICVATAFAYIPATSVALIMVVRLIHGAGFGLTTTGLGTMAADIVPAERRGEGLGYFGMATNVGMALGPGLGIAVMNWLGFGATFSGSALLMSAALLTTFAVTAGRRPVEQTHATVPGLRGLLEPGAFFPASLSLLTGLIFGSVIGFITLFGTESGIGDVSSFFFLYAIVIMATRPISGRLYDRYGPTPVVLAGAGLLSAGLLVLSGAGSQAALTVAAVLYGAGFGSIQPSLQAWAIDRVAPHRRGAATGTYYSSFDIGIGLGALLLGSIAKVSSYAMMYRVAALIPVAIAAALLLGNWLERKRSTG